MKIKNACVTRHVAPALLFSLLLSWLVLYGGWYVPSQIVVTGTASRDMELDLRWDSGGGFNHYERRYFHFAHAARPRGFLNRVEIKNSGEKNPASNGSDVVCLRVEADGTSMELGRFTGDGLLLEPDGLHIPPGRPLEFFVRAQRSLVMEFASNNHTGIVELRVNGRLDRRDLYLANVEAPVLRLTQWFLGPKAEFEVSSPLPRYRIREIMIGRPSAAGRPEISSVAVTTAAGRTETLALRRVDGGTLFYQGANSLRRRFVAAGNLPGQVLFALAGTWALMSLMAAVHKRGWVAGVFRDRGRPFFWGIFGAAVLVYGFWILALWPGVMAVDSLKVWRAARLPDVFLNDHPFLNVLLYRSLLHIWDNPAVVPIVHALALSSMAAFFFHRLRRQGVSVLVLAPSCFFLIFSLPVGLYNTVLWKDIPFALLTVFWALALVWLYDRSRSDAPPLSWQKILLLAAAALSMGLFRHNGLVSLAVLPFFLLGAGVFRTRTFLLVVAGGTLAAALFVCVLYVAHPAVVNSFVGQARAVTGHLAGGGLFDNAGDLFKRYIGIFDVTQTESKWDLWHLFLSDRYAYEFLQRSGWSDAIPYLDPEARPWPCLYDAVLALYRISNREPWVFFSWNPVWLLYIFPLPVLLYRLLPRSALFAGFILVQVALLVFVIRIMNWRYYYFYYLALHFLPSLVAFDLRKRRGGKIFVPSGLERLSEREAR